MLQKPGAEEKAMSPDAKLQRDVLAELNWDPRLSAGHIGVTANAGLITLSGHTENYAEKYFAERAARRVKGVRGVTEEIVVQLGHLGGQTDEDITAAVVNRLCWDVSIPTGLITATVEDSWVTLTGEVPWRFEVEAAGKIAERTVGVLGVTNEVTIRPSVDAHNLEDEITHALHRSWFFDPKLVTVTVHGGNVTLTGVVPTISARKAAERTAWSARGVRHVENRISVAG